LGFFGIFFGVIADSMGVCWGFIWDLFGIYLNFMAISGYRRKWLA
jgi:hypothetical protein